MEYITADPTGNITVLILSGYSSEEERREMIQEAFRVRTDCEQAGFIRADRPGHVDLEMMGHEFCGNASLSACAWRAWTEGIAEDETRTISISSSGIDHDLSVSITRLSDTGGRPCFTGTIAMPMPEFGIIKGYPIAHMDGISHIISCGPAPDMNLAEEILPGFARELDIPALGLMICSSLENEAVNMKPLVYVRGSGTLIWESGCATGSTAAGCYRYHLSSSNDVTYIDQPGGRITLRIEDGVPYLTGNVILEDVLSRLS